VVGLKGTTDGTGTATVSLLSASMGTYVFKEQAVILGGWDYDRRQNAETRDYITVP